MKHLWIVTGIAALATTAAQAQVDVDVNLGQPAYADRPVIVEHQAYADYRDPNSRPEDYDYRDDYHRDQHPAKHWKKPHHDTGHHNGEAKHDDRDDRGHDHN